MSEQPTVPLPSVARPRRRRRAWLAVPLLVVPAAIAIGVAADASSDEPAAAGEPDPVVIAAADTADARPERLPAELRHDLAGLARADRADRPELRAEIREKARAGEYGAEVQAYAERMAERFAALPEALQADLEELAAAEPGERGELARAVRDGVAAGDYGPEVQEQARLISDVLIRDAIRDTLRGR